MSFWKVPRKALLVICLAAATWPLALEAQQGGFMQNKGQQIDQIRRQFFRREVGFTQAEEDKFWPIFYEYNDALKRVRLDIRAKTIPLERGVDNLSEAQLADIANAFVAQKREEAEIYQTYLTKLKGILPMNKVVKVFQAERKFIRFILQQLRQRGQPIPPELEGDGMP